MKCRDHPFHEGTPVRNPILHRFHSGNRDGFVEWAGARVSAGFNHEAHEGGMTLPIWGGNPTSCVRQDIKLFWMLRIRNKPRASFMDCGSLLPLWGLAQPAAPGGFIGHGPGSRLPSRKRQRAAAVQGFRRMDGQPPHSRNPHGFLYDEASRLLRLALLLRQIRIPLLMIRGLGCA